MRSVELLYTVGVANTLGEGVLWNHRSKAVWWTDIERCRLFEYRVDTGKLQRWDTPYRVACFGFIDGSDDLVVAFDRGLALYAPRSGAVDWLVRPGVLSSGTRFNDGKVDARGRLWVGTMVEDEGAPAGSAALYCLDPLKGLVERVRQITISNGLCWSPGGDVMYHADSAAHTIWTHRFDAEEGSVSQRSVFARTAAGVHPDGSTVDAEGGIWNAQWGGGRVVRYTCKGRIDVVIDMPVSQPSCVAFGGESLDLLFVTTAQAGLSPAQLAAEKHAGDLFVYRTGYAGLPVFTFKGKAESLQARSSGSGV